jgi:hypothetical protein
MEQQPLEELAASIPANDVIQPILVRSLSSAGGGAARPATAGHGFRGDKPRRRRCGGALTGCGE